MTKRNQKKAQMGDDMQDQNNMKMDDSGPDSTTQAPAGDPTNDAPDKQTTGDATEETDAVDDPVDDDD